MFETTCTRLRALQMAAEKAERRGARRARRDESSAGKPSVNEHAVANTPELGSLSEHAGKGYDEVARATGANCTEANCTASSCTAFGCTVFSCREAGNCRSFGTKNNSVAHFCSTGNRTARDSDQRRPWGRQAVVEVGELRVSGGWCFREQAFRRGALRADPSARRGRTPAFVRRRPRPRFVE